MRGGSLILGYIQASIILLGLMLLPPQAQDDAHVDHLELLLHVHRVLTTRGPMCTSEVQYKMVATKMLIVWPEGIHQPCSRSRYW